MAATFRAAQLPTGPFVYVTNRGYINAYHCISIRIVFTCTMTKKTTKLYEYNEKNEHEQNIPK